MKKIIAIYENSYGCEERNDNEALKYFIVLGDDVGNSEELLVEDNFLTANNLDVGSIWPE